MPRILVIEDEPALLDSLRRGLSEEGYDVSATGTLAAAHGIVADEPIDAVLLDLMLPDGDGLEFCRGLRQISQSIPVLMATARDSVADRITGLDAGADDYLIKPFSFDELLARLRALLRRSALPQSSKLVVDDLELDLLDRSVVRAGCNLDMTIRQFDLLKFFVEHAGEIVNREMIAEEVWNEPTATWTNVIEVQVNHLRRKLERPEWPTILHTIRGRGYQLGVTK
ncbi:MAG: response regulator transcription factor [Planctomycetales bacterium]|nr:response regulator transcription factor [Planctomycetales bacterium]